MMMMMMMIIIIIISPSSSSSSSSSSSYQRILFDLFLRSYVHFQFFLNPRCLPDYHDCCSQILTNSCHKRNKFGATLLVSKKKIIEDHSVSKSVDHVTLYWLHYYMYQKKRSKMDNSRYKVVCRYQRKQAQLVRDVIPSGRISLTDGYLLVMHTFINICRKIQSRVSRKRKILNSF